MPWLRRLVTGLLPRRPGFSTISDRVRFVMVALGSGKEFFSEYFKFPSQYHSTNAPFSSSSAHYYYQDKRAKPGNLPKSNALLGIGQHWTDKCGHFFFLLQSVDFRGYVVKG